MRRACVKLVGASGLALLGLALCLALLVQAAPVHPLSPTPVPAPQEDDALVWVSVLAAPGAGVERFFVGPVYHRTVGGLERIAGKAPAAVLPDLANWPGVIHVPSAGPLPQPPQPDWEADVSSSDFSRPLPAGVQNVTTEVVTTRVVTTSTPERILAPTGWYENDTQGVRATWNTLGLTGTGVTIAIIDSGVDFGNPALAGRYAVQPATPTGTQSYVGWPVAFDDRSLSNYLAYPTRAWPINWGWYVNANHAITGSGVFTFADPLSPATVYTVPGTSRSGRYLLGHHPDTSLGNTPLLVADEAITATYDAVYADLNGDGAFETRMTRQQPVGVLDLTGDGVPDVSAGMLYWIADGLNPPPGAQAVYGTGVSIPPTGTLLAFMIDSLWESGGGHGTMCAGTAVGNDGGIFVPEPRVPSFYTTTYGPLVQGPAPGAKVMAIGNVYASGSLDAWYLFTMLGYDGVPASGDEPQIVTLSYGNGPVDNDGWDWESRYLAYLNLTYGDTSPLLIHSAGNGGFGYGTLTSPNPATGLIVGASTQFGTLNNLGISETVSLPSRVNTGDVASFSGRGPGADGTRAVDLVANGMYGTGAYPLNVSGDGTRAYVHWYGTSRSAPVVGGMAALVAQGFRQTHGRFPTREELGRLLINGARDLGYDPLVQGAGQADAFHAAQRALGQSGAVVDPPSAMAGDFRGQRYPSFAAGLTRGETQTLTFTVTNPATVPVTVALGAQHLVEVARITTTLQTITDTVTNYGKGVPDYALNLTPWVTAHPEADLMVVRLTVPFEHFDSVPPNPPTVRNAWRLMVYNWWDDDADGAWWNDLNGDGRVDWPGEIDGGDEWMRFDYSRLSGVQQEVRVGRPYARSLGAGSGGIWAGATHNITNVINNRTTLSFEVVFYRQAGWPDVSLSTSTLHLLPGGQATFQAAVHVPPDAAYGLYEGAIVVTSTDRSLVPLTWQVWPDAETGASLGGTPGAATPYDNGWVRGGFDWVGRGEVGDWRFYGFDLQDPPPGSVILAHNVWGDYPTDLDTLIFGPSPDEFSEAAPAWFGPYTLDLVGGSVRTGNRPAWRFATATGATEEWVSAPAQDGLHELVHQAVLFGGHQAGVPFTTALGLATVEPYPLRVDPGCGVSCTVTATFRASLDIPGGLTGTHAFAWFTPTFQATPLITQGYTVTHAFTLTQAAYRLDVTLLDVSGASDLDLLLYDDSGSVPGTWDPGDRILSQASGPGVDKSLQAHHNLVVGQYWVLVQGQAVDPGGGSYDLEILAAPWASDEGLEFDGLPAEVVAGQVYTFTLHVNRPAEEGQQGLVVLGPWPLTETLEVPVLVEPLTDLWVRKSGPAGVHPGETITYTITYGNPGPSEAHGVWLSDTLPLSVTTTAPTALGPLTLTVGSTYIWTLTATGGTAVPVGMVLTNTARIAGQEYDLVAGNNVATAAAFVAPVANLWVRKSGPAGVHPGEVITYTITYGNLGPSEAHGVWLTDTLPPGVTTAAPTTLGPLTLAANVIHTWTLTATVRAGVPVGTALINTVRIAGQEYDPLAEDNAGAAASSVVPYTVYLPVVMKQTL